MLQFHANSREIGVVQFRALDVLLFLLEEVLE